MGSFSLFHWLLFGGVAILVLGGGRFSAMMGDVAKGVKQFKKGLAEDEEATKEPTRIEAKREAEPAFDAKGEPIRDDR